MNDVVITYICDHKACINCTYPQCNDTLDIRHAKNFDSFFVGTKTRFYEKDPEGVLGNPLLTSEAVDFVNKYPELINNLVTKYSEVTKEIIQGACHEK